MVSTAEGGRVNTTNLAMRRWVKTSTAPVIGFSA